MFRITSKNCDMVLTVADSQSLPTIPTIPYGNLGVDATLRTGSGNLTATFQSNIATDGSSTTDTEPILQSVNSFALLTCSNPVVPSPFLDSNEPMYQEAGSLVSPFFYRDSTDAATSDELTFFVLPSLTEKIVEWEGWPIPPASPAPNWRALSSLNQIKLVSQVPVAGPVPITPGD